MGLQNPAGGRMRGGCGVRLSPRGEWDEPATMLRSEKKEGRELGVSLLVTGGIVGGTWARNPGGALW